MTTGERTDPTDLTDTAAPRAEPEPALTALTPLTGTDAGVCRDGVCVVPDPER